MPREISFFSLLIPGLLPIFAGSVITYWLIDRGLAAVGLYRHVWHPALFRAAMFVCLFSGVALLLGT
ncbi:DUF1656 domain-containing protein [Paraburkholderia sp. J63]|uniref:DUF1656 domain-containing protein n=1 Tax=Paraburkholderia sp. J63 TaxID=2805434 RepID=UPI002ABDC6AC|nr:DUF1656 domain-containing protein [Paraburkholderia sp. J63]